MYTNETTTSNLNKKLLKYPFHGGEKRLIDKFLIIGYDFPTFRKELIAQTLKTENNQNNISNSILFQQDKTTQIPIYELDLNLYSFIFNEYPIVLNDISSNYSKSSFDNEQIIEMIYPKIPKSYLCRKDNFKHDKFSKTNCIIFNSNPHEGLNSKRSFNCLAYNFYKTFEKEINKVKYIYLIPISFCFISEFPFYYSFSLLAFQIKHLFEREILDIPLELILYNMVAFTPSPINHVVTLNIVPIKFNSEEKKIEDEFEIVGNKKKKKFDLLNTPEITFPILSGYPLMQYNLLKVLFTYLTPQLIIEIFIWSILEKDILFFSKNLEHLNLLMYSFINLNYPLNDGQYYWINVSVSFDTFINGNSSFVGKSFSSILGICDSFELDKIKKSNNFKEYICVDVEKGQIHYFCKNDNLKNMIRKLCKSGSISKKDKNDLYVAIKRLYLQLDKLKHINKNDNNLNFIEYDDNIKQKNKEIQEEFYIFIIQICLYFYNNLEFLTPSDQIYNNNNIINNGSFIIQFNEKNNIKNYTSEEKSFLTQLKETMKFDSFVHGFIQSFDSIDLYKIPLTILEEFITMTIQRKKRNNEKNKVFRYLDFIDNFYKAHHQNDININFNQFESYYHKEMEKKFFRDLFEFEKWQLKKKNVLCDNGLTKVNFSYKYFEINHCLLIKYIHYLNNLTKEEMSMIFPLYNKMIENEIETFDRDTIDNLIEENIIELNILTSNDLLCNCIILIFSLSIHFLNFNDVPLVNSFILSISKPKFLILRKYYSLIADIFYRLFKKAEIDKQYKRRFIFLNFYYQMLNKIRENKIVPNENLLNLVKLFDKMELDTKLNNNENIDDEIDDNNEIKFNLDDFTHPQSLYQFVNNAEKFKLGDNIDFMLLKNNKIIKCNLIDNNTLFTILSQLSEDYNKNLDSNIIDKTLMNKCIINTIFYVEKNKYFEQEKISFLSLLIRLLVVFFN